jgi:hypothetical protein
MMPRYYEAQALIEFVKQFSPSINGETTLECVERAIRNAPTADVVPRSEVERLTIELEAMQGVSNSYKLQYEQAQAEKDNLIATYEACMRTYSEQLFGEIEQEIKHALDSNYKARQEHIDKYFKGTSYVYDNFISLVNGKIQALRGIDDFLDELKKKHIGE